MEVSDEVLDEFSKWHLSRNSRQLHNISTDIGSRSLQVPAFESCVFAVVVAGLWAQTQIPKYPMYVAYCQRTILSRKRVKRVENSTALIYGNIIIELWQKYCLLANTFYHSVFMCSTQIRIIAPVLRAWLHWNVWRRQMSFEYTRYAKKFLVKYQWHGIATSKQLFTNLLTLKIRENLCKVAKGVFNLAWVAHRSFPVRFWPGHFDGLFLLCSAMFFKALANKEIILGIFLGISLENDVGRLER